MNKRQRKFIIHSFFTLLNFLCRTRSTTLLLIYCLDWDILVKHLFINDIFLSFYFGTRLLMWLFNFIADSLTPIFIRINNTKCNFRVNTEHQQKNKSFITFSHFFHYRGRSYRIFLIVYVTVAAIFVLRKNRPFSPFCS